MLTQRFKIELCHPLGLALWMILFYVGFHPTLIYIAPLGLAFDNLFGSTRISLPKFFAIIYMLTQRFKIKLYRPFGARMERDVSYSYGFTLRCFMSPLRGFSFDKTIGSTRISLPKTKLLFDF